jgi:hypothetical protein
MPSQVEIDLALLTEPDSVIRAGDISLPGNVTVLTDLEVLVVRIELPRVEVEGERVDAEGTPAEEESPATGEEDQG